MENEIDPKALVKKAREFKINVYPARPILDLAEEFKYSEVRFYKKIRP